MRIRQSFFKGCFYLVLICKALLCANEPDLVVHLKTTPSLLTLHLAPFVIESTNQNDLNALYDVLCFDLNQNGLTQITTNPNKADCNLTFTVKEKWMEGKLVLTHDQEEISLQPRQISGYHASDRRVMHLIADEIHEKITGEKGIASTQILYALSERRQKHEKTVWESEIWMADYDGENAHQLTHDKGYCISPLFVPRNRFSPAHPILYVTYKQGQSKIYTYILESQKTQPLLQLRGNQFLPTLSRCGHHLAFVSDVGGRADLFIQSFDPDKGVIGKPMQVYSFPYSVQASPTFSPDGKKIAFVSDKDHKPRIYLIDTPTLGSRQRPKLTLLTKHYRETTSPAWSPDGTKLAYSAKIKGIRQIVMHDFQTGEDMELTTGKEHKSSPCWAPNSLHLIFNQTSPTSSELFLINLKQKNMVQITQGTGKKHYPMWGFFTN